MKKMFYILIPVLLSYASKAQKKSEFKDGYALRGNDTIQCQLLFKVQHGDPGQSLILLIGDEQSTFYPGGSITGFGIKEDKEMIHYGTVSVQRVIADRSFVNLLFIKKLVAGKIDFYEYAYSYQKTTTKTVTRNGVPQPGSSSSSVIINSTDYYIAKNDSASLSFAKPVLLPSFRKKDLEPYISDNEVMWASTENKYNLKELIVLLKRYNSWFMEKK